ncbi:hypothetical protein COD53_29550 [Escherichia coli]|nr:hypothetical protein COD53_29550 [Escherichia coli]QHR48775.1 hypothetical protein FNE85_25630 [Escherichia coli]
MFHTIVSIKNDGHYFCRAGGNRPDGLNEPVTLHSFKKKNYSVPVLWTDKYAPPTASGGPRPEPL